MPRSMVAFLCLAGVCCAAEDAQKTIMLVGGTGNGKSETGNTILGKSEFKVSARQRSETRQLQHGRTFHRGMEHLVYDTPGWFGAGMEQQEAERKIEELAVRSDRGVDAFILVVAYGRFDDNAMRTYQRFKNMFGAAAMKHTILAFTKASNFTREEVSEETAEICAEEPSSNQCRVLQELGSSRILAIGDLTPERRRSDREQIMQQVESLSTANGGAAYDHDIFKKARLGRERLRERIERLDGEVKDALLRMLAEVRRGDATDEKLEASVAQAEAEQAERRAKEARVEEKLWRAEELRHQAEERHRAEQSRLHEELRRAHSDKQFILGAIVGAAGTVVSLR